MELTRRRMLFGLGATGVAAVGAGVLLSRDGPPRRAAEPASGRPSAPSPCSAGHAARLAAAHDHEAGHVHGAGRRRPCAERRPRRLDRCGAGRRGGPQRHAQPDGASPGQFRVRVDDDGPTVSLYRADRRPGPMAAGTTATLRISYLVPPAGRALSLEFADAAATTTRGLGRLETSGACDERAHATRGPVTPTGGCRDGRVPVVSPARGGRPGSAESRGGRHGATAVLDLYVNEGLVPMVDDSLVYMRGFGASPDRPRGTRPSLRISPQVFLADGRLVSSRSTRSAPPLPEEGRPDPLAPHPDLPGEYLIRREYWASFFPDRTIIAETGSTVRLRVHNRLTTPHGCASTGSPHRAHRTRVRPRRCPSRPRPPGTYVYQRPRWRIRRADPRAARRAGRGRARATAGGSAPGWPSSSGSGCGCARTSTRCGAPGPAPAR